MLDQLIELPQHFGLQTLIIIGILILLEAVLSADNAIALAAIVQGLHDPKLEQQALNWGLAVAFILRIMLILTATWVLKFPIVSIAGGGVFTVAGIELLTHAGTSSNGSRIYRNAGAVYLADHSDFGVDGFGLFFR